ncbi:zinc ribbon domain-containing protein [Candidatus Ozemobacteraceae bacterium]|nr:zinc ribbon domain-containing protein [Candidatus Ozemobacteraceae bacterium]
MRYTRILTAVLLVLALLTALPSWAIRVICPQCNTLAELTDETCKKCRYELNKCLKCGTLNPVSADFCEGEDCAEPLAEMRLLGRIDEETRKELRLGQSERAQLDRELQSIGYLLEKDPSKSAKLLFRRARIYQQMDFPAKEATAWQEYLQQFPDTKKKAIITVFLSEALRKWGYLFYTQGDKPTALSKFEAATAANPANADAWMWVGRMKSESKESNAAADAYMKALQAEPGNKTAIHFLRKFKRQIPTELLKPVKKAPDAGKAAKPSSATPAAPAAPAAPTAPSVPAPAAEPAPTTVSPDAPAISPDAPAVDDSTAQPANVSGTN